MIDVIAKNLARVAHAGDVDKAGVDYFAGHLSAVAAGVSSPLAKAAAFLHDVLEDTAMVEADLRAALLDGGAGAADVEAVVAAVVALSKVDGEHYDDYLARVEANPLAVEVKLADLAHNSDLSRLASVSDKDLARVEKYRAAIARLSA